MKPMFKTKPKFTEVDPHRLLVNVGALMDIPTGKYVRGQKGENLLNGGLSLITGMVGRGNTFKSTIMHYMVLSAASKMAESGIAPYINTYDTEMNMDLDRLLEFSKSFDKFKDVDILHQGIWSVTDKTLHIGNEWYELLKDFLIKEKVKNKSSYTLDTPFLDKDGKVVKSMFPTFGEIDSISEFETSDITEMSDKNELGDKGAQTIYMRAGLAKTRLLMELPRLCNSSSHYLAMAAHLGETIPMNQGPMSGPPPKELQHMRGGEKIKGVPPKFLFLPNTVWSTVHARVMLNQSTKGPEYPRVRDQVDEGSLDLNQVTIRVLRSKHGPSGTTIPLIISQREGVLPSLSEFHYIKESGRFGLEGNNVTYNLVLYPEVKIGRTTIRNLVDTDPKLRKAIKFTADILQIKEFMKDLPYEVPSMEDLYSKLEKEYGWDLLLNTRDFWTFNNYDHPVPYLSAMDLIEMFHEKYRPYWIPSGWKKGDPIKMVKGK